GATTCPTLTISPSADPEYHFANGVPGQTYPGATITMSGGSGTYDWVMGNGTFPPGLDHPGLGIEASSIFPFAGTPTQVGHYRFNLGAFDAPGGVANLNCPGASGWFEIDVPVANVGVGQSASPQPVKQGTRVTYTITVQNGGQDPAVNAKLRD